MDQNKLDTQKIINSLKNVEIALNKSCKQGIFNLNEATQLHTDLLFISTTINTLINKKENSNAIVKKNETL